MAARPTRILSYSRTIVFRKRTKVRRENAHLHALATWRARNTCDMRRLERGRILRRILTGPRNVRALAPTSLPNMFAHE